VWGLKRPWGSRNTTSLCLISRMTSSCLSKLLGWREMSLKSNKIMKSAPRNLIKTNLRWLLTLLLTQGSEITLQLRAKSNFWTNNLTLVATVSSNSQGSRISLIIREAMRGAREESTLTCQIWPWTMTGNLETTKLSLKVWLSTVHSQI
jgi:hypothetical protein